MSDYANIMLFARSFVVKEPFTLLSVENQCGNARREDVKGFYTYLYEGLGTFLEEGVFIAC